MKSLNINSAFLKGALASLILLASCTKDELSNVASDPNTLTFQSSITTASRATGNQFDINDKIAVTSYDISGTAHRSNVEYTYDGQFTSTDPIKYTEDYQRLSFWAIYPYTELSDDGIVEFSTLTNQADDTNYTLSDLMSSYAAATSASSPTLVFNHLLSNVIIDITSEDITLINVKSYIEAATDIQYNVFYGSYSDASETKSEISMASNGTYSYKAIIVPQSYSTGDTIGYISIDGAKYPIIADKDYDFKSGKEYVLSLDISATGGEIEITFGDVSINDWGTDEAFDTRVETYVTKSYYIAPTILPGDAEPFGSGYDRPDMWDNIYNNANSCFAALNTYESTIGKTVTFGLGMDLDITRFSISPRGTRQFSRCMIKRFNMYGTSKLTDEMYVDDGTGMPNFDGWDLILEDAQCLPISGSDTPTDEDIAYLEANGSEFDVPYGIGDYRFIRFEVLETWEGGTTFSIGELDFWGYVVDDTDDGTTSVEPDADGVYRVSSLADMQPLLKMDNVQVELATGDYYVTPMDITNGVYSATAEVVEGTYTSSIFLVEGNGSTYDFGNSTITINADAYDVAGCEAYPLHIIGSENTVKNYTQVDDGEAIDVHVNGVTNVVIDGRENIVENITIHSTGSYPYGYGECFGKGGTNTVIGHYKHCGVLVRGLDNIFRDSHVYHRAYGHCVFMQGAFNPTIENCYIEGAISTTEAIYAEKGTGSAADNANFRTTWGFYMTENFKYTMALTEEGIRAYNGGNTIIDGVRYENGTTSPTILNNTVKNARAGVTLTHASGTKYVEGCTIIGCDRGFAIGSGNIVDCYADAQFGPAFGVDYSTDSGITAEITIIDGSSAEYVTVDGVDYKTSNGTGHIAYIFGKNHNLTFRDGRTDKDAVIYTTCADPNISECAFDLGGDCRTIGEIWEDEYSEGYDPETLDDDMYPLTSSTITNYTTWPIRIDSEATGNTIYSNGEVTEEIPGNNTVYRIGEW
ncbi:MAG: fimbrillin family protein [Rikenellaceae bacterium]